MISYGLRMKQRYGFWVGECQCWRWSWDDTDRGKVASEYVIHATTQHADELDRAAKRLESQ